MATVEVRCPDGFGRLFMKLQLSGETPTITEGNLFEFACTDCRKYYKEHGEQVSLVLHRFDFLGRSVETEIVRIRR